MSTQYDAIGQKYKSMSDLPSQAPEKPSVLNVLGDVEGLNCLDLACGLGRWSHTLLEQGAAHVTGIDISAGMIDSARASLRDLPESQRAKVDFQVGDCGKPFAAPHGPFDVTLGVWFLNYASNYEEMASMWQNIAANLKPGGRFVALTSNPFVGLEAPFDDRYGIDLTTLGRTEEGGWKCRVTGYTQPEPVEFENYHQPEEVYERAAAEAGMQNLTWRSHVLPNDGRPEGYWDVYNLRPHYSLLTAVKPE
ncbi:Uu.00g129820.m01.CDS01 [Anthostomella pinea]|uniref:Uu.00g129820.m01.CDS01 n=1 Tax=Anthostomella pinea TaxID=933095 RepID=A0AAI8VIH9_9PEZI|nr:Uu.00g129820.m01.CDS01 [Anthostomella pinea]